MQDFDETGGRTCDVTVKGPKRMGGIRIELRSGYGTVKGEIWRYRSGPMGNDRDT